MKYACFVEVNELMLYFTGTFPTEADGIVNKTACMYGDGDCCKNEVQISIRNCSGFYAYYLRALKQCPASYCFGKFYVLIYTFI